MQFTPYLNFDGNAEEAFRFYKSVFGGDFALLVRFKDMGGGPPGAPGLELPPVVGGLVCGHELLHRATQ